MNACRIGEVSREGFGDGVAEEVDERIGVVEARCSSLGDDDDADWCEGGLAVTDPS